MIKPQVLYTNRTLLFVERPLIHGSSSHILCLPMWSERPVPKHNIVGRQKMRKRVVTMVHRSVEAEAETDVVYEKKSWKVKGIVKVKVTKAGFFSSLRLDKGIDDITDLLGKSILLDLVSSQLDSGIYSLLSLLFHFILISFGTLMTNPEFI